LSAREPVDRDVPDQPDESFLSRWSRRKAEARAVEPAAADSLVVEPTAPAVAPASVASPPVEAPAGQSSDPRLAAVQAPATELPDLDQLGADSDYSAFLTPGVDADLRRRALRKLFSSPKFNVFDGLDTYRDDYTSFPALGSIVTADMRYHVERLAKQVAEALDQQTAPAAPVEAATPAAIVATGGDDVTPTPGIAALEAPAAEPPPPAPEEDHDRIA
jgi:hypothetical protein